MIGFGRRRRKHTHSCHGGAFDSTLDKLPVGSRGVIKSIQGERRMRRRLMEMGLIEGSLVRVVKLAANGDPLEIKVNDYFLSLRRREAALIRVCSTG